MNYARKERGKVKCASVVKRTDNTFDMSEGNFMGTSGISIHATLTEAVVEQPTARDRLCIFGAVSNVVATDAICVLGTFLAATPRISKVANLAPAIGYAPAAYGSIAVILTLCMMIAAHAIVKSRTDCAGAACCAVVSGIAYTVFDGIA